MNKALGTLGLSIAAALGACLAHAAEPSPPALTAPDPAALPNDAWGATVRYGRDLLTQTAKLIGPQAQNPALRYAGNNLACQSCHIDAGTKAYGLPLTGAFADYPNYRAREGKVGTLPERINGCLTRSLNGKPMPEGSAQMTAIIAYLRFLSFGSKVGTPISTRGPGPIQTMSRAADPIRGQDIYSAQCAACHGSNGQGQRAAPGDPTFAIPALWGDDSFNDGAGMARLSTAAAFIRNNMPHGTSWTAPSLTEADAWDVAAFLEAQPRPHMAGLERDYPKLNEKPVDAPYGPYADSFPAIQHKYGPFGPIRATLNASIAASKDGN